jgi:flagellar capping protein FliD
MQYLKTVVCISGVLALFVVGCGGSAVPLDKLTDAKATVRAAQEAGAETTPQAALHLKMANDELASAQKAMDDKDNDRARLLLNQAQSDADLSLALARGTTEKQQAQDAQAKIDGLLKQQQQ